MTAQNYKQEANEKSSQLEELTDRIRYIHYRVQDIASQADDNYKVLREILDATTHENGMNWYDLYDTEGDHL